MAWLFIALLGILFQPNFINAVPPISGTFIVPDISYKSESEYRQFFQELKDTGINLVIFTLTNNLIKNCATNTFTEEFDNRLYAGNPPFLPIATKLALEMNMTVYFDLGQHPISNCFQFYNGKLFDETTDKGRLISFSLRAIDKIKIFLTQNNISWENPLFAGFYLAPEGNTQELANPNSSQLLFFTELSNQIKQKEPNKKIMISPYQYESATYDISKNAFTNLFSKTNIDIIAPQDSLGTHITTTFNRSSDHFRALRDVVSNFPDKSIYANVETFEGSGPADFIRIKNQIAAVQPYVPRIITWIYQQTMLSNPLSDNIASINIYAPYYTPENAIRRRELRNTYLNFYGPPLSPTPTTPTATTLFYIKKSNYTCISTTNTYTSLDDCVTNLKIYLPNQTTEQCYLNINNCKNATSSYLQPGDANHDKVVDLADFSVWKSEYLGISKLLNSDFDHNNMIDLVDFGIWKIKYLLL